MSGSVCQTNVQNPTFNLALRLTCAPSSHIIPEFRGEREPDQSPAIPPSLSNTSVDFMRQPVGYIPSRKHPYSCLLVLQVSTGVNSEE